MSNALQKLREFVEYVEKLAKESEHGFSPKKTSILRADFMKLKLLVEAEYYRFEHHIIPEVEFLENKLDAILTEAESRFEVHKAGIEYRWLKYLCALLIGGGLLGLLVKLLG